MSSDRSPLMGVRKNRFRGNSSPGAEVINYTEEQVESNHEEHRAYGARFWILFSSCFNMFFHCVEWNTWGPITESVKSAYGWDNGTLALLPGWVSMMFVVCIAPVCWVAQNLGLRFAMLFSAGITTAGLILRCIPVEDKIFTMMCHVAAIMLGIGSAVTLAVPPMIASDWFKPKERTSAIAVMVGVSQLGSIASFLEPLIVRSPGPNVTTADIKNDVMVLMYIGAGVSAFIFFAIVVYFPSKPPTPPSNASSAPRINFKASLSAMSKNWNLWLIMLAYGVSVGPSLAWVTTLDTSLIPLGMNQNEAMWVGISAVLSAAVVGIISGRITDLVFGHLKITIIGLLLSASGFFFWFLLLSTGTIPFSKWQVYVSISSGMAMNFATITLFLEMSAEVAYPVPEIIVGGIVTGADNFFSTIFLLIYQMPNIGYQWVIYTMIASNALIVIPVLFIKESYSRSKLDRPDLE